MKISNKTLDYVNRYLSSYWPFLGVTLVNFLLVYHWIWKRDIQLATAEDAILFYSVPLHNLLYMTSYAWSYTEIGRLSGFTTASWPFYLISYYLSVLGLSPAQIQGLWFFALMELGSISIIKLTKYMVDNDLIGNIASFLAAIFYLLNPISSIVVWNRFLYSYMFFYFFIPFFIYAVLTIIFKNSRLMIYISILLSFIFSNSFSAPTYMVSFLLFMVPFAVLLSLLTRRNLSKILSLLIGILGANAFWISTYLPYYLHLSQSPESFDIGSYNWNVSFNEFLNVGQREKSIFSAFSFSVPTFYSYLYSFWVQEYNLKLLGLITYTTISIILSGVSFITIISIKNLKKDIKSFLRFIFLVYTILILNFIAGASSPLGQINTFLFEHFPLFVVYRASVEKFSLLLPIFLSPLFGTGIYVLISRILTHSFRILGRFVVVATFLGLITLSGWPMLTGAVFTSIFPVNNNPEIGFYTVVPSYYTTLNNYIIDNNITGYRFVVLPESGAGNTYEWPIGYNGIELADQLFYGDVIAAQLYPPNTTSNYSNQIFLKYINVSWKYMYLLDAKYVVVQTDVNYTYRGLPNPHLFLSVINSTKDYVLLFHDGALYLYENKLVPNPKMINAYTSVVTVNDFKQFLDMLYYNSSYYPNQTVVVIRNLAPNAPVVSLSSSKPPVVEYREVNPSVYVVKIVNATSPFYLVLNQYYSPYWRAYYGVVNPYNFSILTAQGYVSGFEVNGYATAFFINRTGTFYITIINIVQVYMNLGMIITGITLFSSILILAFNMYKFLKIKIRYFIKK